MKARLGSRSKRAPTISSCSCRGTYYHHCYYYDYYYYYCYYDYYYYYYYYHYYYYYYHYRHYYHYYYYHCADPIDASDKQSRIRKCGPNSDNMLLCCKGWFGPQATKETRAMPHVQEHIRSL